MTSGWVLAAIVAWGPGVGDVWIMLFAKGLLRVLTIAYKAGKRRD